jgi:hypothetical protein
MYYIVETQEQLQELHTTGSCFVQLIAKSEFTHPKLTTPSLVYYNNLEKGYIIVVDHSEGFNLTMSQVQSFLDSHSEVYVLDKKYHSYFIDPTNCIDINFAILDEEGSLKDFGCDTPLHRDFYHRFKYHQAINGLIPISKHYERFECLFGLVSPFIGKESNLAWQNEYVDSYKWIEEQGLTINPTLFDKHFEPNWGPYSVIGNKVYTKYNLYNTTSRPTNAFNSINFLALAKENNSRTSFIPQYDALVEFDFDGYHIRLIANLLNLTIPTDVSIHTYLGKQYFGKEELTDEEYQESKKITFEQMYGGVKKEYQHIEFFQQIQQFIQKLEKEYQDTGYIVLPNGRKIQQTNSNAQKLFNYYIQCLETVVNVRKLQDLKKVLHNKKSKPILMVYDSVLIDFSKEDGKETLQEIRNTLELGNYLVKVKFGKNYNF